jgi:RimJ/RimL family protein N-acetyltransferase
MPQTVYQFFRSAPTFGVAQRAALPDDLEMTLWRPRLLHIRPRGAPLFPYFVWWIFHYLHVFGNRGYSIVVIRSAKELVHRSCVFPKYFRFPFMKRDALQIGDTWTRPDYRGRGLASIALIYVVEQLGSKYRPFWYIVASDNHASVRAVMKSGFELIGKGQRYSRLGVGVLGYFGISEEADRR